MSCIWEIGSCNEEPDAFFQRASERIRIVFCERPQVGDSAIQIVVSIGVAKVGHRFGKPEIGPDGSRPPVMFAECRRTDSECAHEERLGGCKVLFCKIHRREIMQRDGNIRVIGSQRFFVDPQTLIE